MRAELITAFIAGSFVLLTCAKPQGYTADSDRYKRSMFKDGLTHRYRPFHGVPLRKRNEAKRGFDTLDLDLLFSDPMFLEFEKEQKEKEKANNLETKDMHNLDFDPTFNNNLDMQKSNDDNILDSVAENEFHGNLPNKLQNEVPSLEGIQDFPNELPEITNLRKEKNEMSNVIPGSIGPFDHTNSIYNRQNYSPYVPPLHAQDMADELMEEFLEFSFLKSAGLLDNCVGFRKRK